MDFSNIKSRDVRTHYDFNKYDDHFEYVDSNDSTGVYIYKRTNEKGRITCYEVFKPKYKVKDDAYLYPSSSDFGNNAYCIMPDDIEWGRWMMENGLPSVADYKPTYNNFLKSKMRPF